MMDEIIEDIAHMTFLRVKYIPVVEEITREDFIRYAVEARKAFDIQTCGYWESSELPPDVVEYLVTDCELRFLRELYDRKEEAICCELCLLGVVHDEELTRFMHPLERLLQKIKFLEVDAEMLMFRILNKQQGGKQ